MMFGLLSSAFDVVSCASMIVAHSVIESRVESTKAKCPDKGCIATCLLAAENVENDQCSAVRFYEKFIMSGV